MTVTNDRYKDSGFVYGVFENRNFTAKLLNEATDKCIPGTRIRKLSIQKLGNTKDKQWQARMSYIFDGSVIQNELPNTTVNKLCVQLEKLYENTPSGAIDY